MKELIDTRTEQDFQWAQTRAFLSRLMHMFNPGEEDLLPFEEAKALLRPQGEVYAGIAAVPVEKIVGSEGRYRDFNRHFLPRKEYLRHRWTSIDRTRYQDIILPPVRLYEMGGVYFVRDGNHRVSVARSMGQLEIDAEITSLQSKITVDPDTSKEELKAAVIAYEKKAFYASSHYLNVLGVDDLDFSEPGRYDTIREHIEVHKYYLNQHESVEIDWGSALVSWHENVYGPMVLAIREEKLLYFFPGRTEGDLYLFLVQHWDELKHRLNRDVPIGDATKDFKTKVGAGAGSLAGRFFRDLGRKLKNIIK
jgi:hypothetical protein